MIIIVEGIDRVGKTTLCNKLKEKFGYDILKFDKIEAEDVRCANYGSIKMFIEMSKYLEQNYIIDRFHWTEIVYGACERGYFNNEVLELEKEMVTSDNFILIYMRPLDIEKSSEEHGKDLKGHNLMFEMLYNFSNLRKISCSYKTIDEAVNYISDFIK